MVAIPILRQVSKRAWLQPPLDRMMAPFNLFDPQRYVDPYPLYERARREGAVFFHERARTWFVTGYAEAEEVLRGPGSVDRSGDMERFRPYSQLAPSTRELFNSMMLMKDPPDHGRLRRLVNRAFTPRAVTDLEPRVEGITKDLLGEVGGARSIDAMERFADRLPIYVIAEMLGLPAKQRDQLKRISDVAAQFIDAISGFDPREMDSHIGDFVRLMEPVIEAREREPENDILSALIAAEEGGDRLSRQELLSMVMLLMVAGHETTSGLIGNALVALDRHRDARQLLLGEPSIAENAVEEFLRFDSPVQYTARFSMADFEVGGHTIKRGDPIIVLLGAANHDPRRYEAPHWLRLDRPDPRPISFGHGAHHCLGAALARLEARIAIPAFVEAFPNYRVDEQTLAWKQSNTLRGPKHLPIELTPPTPPKRSK